MRGDSALHLGSKSPKLWLRGLHVLPITDSWRKTLIQIPKSSRGYCRTTQADKISQDPNSAFNSVQFSSLHLKRLTRVPHTMSKSLMTKLVTILIQVLVRII
ncbi:hypothetical protein N7G274_004830 [Stereocaulon virgatum]|uniref:Uncharacterized protein n=1 Tax=Stereocaulon virgatum TaxID=373712 RepID=A0ABR4AA79_9LECA